MTFLIRVSSLLLIGLVGALPVCAQTADGPFLEGLRSRHLYRLANLYCEQRLGDDSLTDVERADLTIQWSRTLTAEALNSLPAERSEKWSGAVDLLEEFIAAHPNHPRSLLIQLQIALTTLTQGELASQEFELGLLGADSIELPRQLLREAIGQLESVDEELDTLLRQPSTVDGTLSNNQLQSLKRNVCYQVAKAYRLQGLTYLAEPDDRVRSISLSLERLESLTQRTTRDTLFWKSRIDEIIGLRLLGRFAEASARLDALDGQDPSSDIRIKLRTQRVRLLLSEHREVEAADLLQVSSDAPFETSADWQIAWLEVCLAMADKAASDENEQEVSVWQQRAVAVVEGIGRRHSLYWCRRAEAMLARSAEAGLGTGNLDILERMAIESARRGAWDDALAAYDVAAAKAVELHDNDRMFDLLFTAAVIEHHQLRYDEAIRRFRDLAHRLPENEQAPQAHLLATFDASQLVSSDEPTTQDRYLELLREHLSLWPGSKTASQAAWWLARIEEAQNHWLPAAEAYALVHADSEDHVAAVTGYGRCSRRRLENLSENERETTLVGITETLEAYYLDEQRQPLSPWTAAGRAAVIEGATLSIFFRDDYASADRILSAALADATDASLEWISSARVLLVVAYAGGQKRDEAQQLLDLVTSGDPEQWIVLLTGLSAIIDDAPRPVQRELAHLQLQAITQLEPHRDNLSNAQQCVLDRTKAEALADAGRRSDALEAYEQAAEQYSNDAATQEGYARLLSAGDDRTTLDLAVGQWRLVVFHAEPQSSLWFRGKYELALVHFRLGHRDRAAQMIQLLRTLHPDLGGEPQKAQFLQLLSQCEE